MRRSVAIFGVVLLSVSVAMAQQSAKPEPGAKAKASGTVAQALMDLENQWQAAAKASKGDALVPLLAEDFVALDSDGSMHGKADVVARTTKSKWETNEIGDMKVTMHGDAGIVTGTWTGKGTDDKGKAVDAKERWADTWVKMPNGKWQCVASASAPVK
jgi:ketosteroid isomerase-like protein